MKRPKNWIPRKQRVLRYALPQGVQPYDYICNTGVPHYNNPSKRTTRILEKYEIVYRKGFDPDSETDYSDSDEEMPASRTATKRQLATPTSSSSPEPNESPIKKQSQHNELATKTSSKTSTVESPDLQSLPVSPELAESKLASPEHGVSPTSAPQPANSNNKPRRTRTLFPTVDFSQVTVEIPPPGPEITILYRPSGPDATFYKANSMAIYKEFKANGHPFIGNRAIRNGGLALDFPPDAPVAELLQISSILSLPVTASLPMAPKGLSGVISGVHWDIPDSEIQENITTQPQVAIEEVKRLARPGQQSWSVKLTFSGSELPERAVLFGKRHEIKPYVSKPLMCFNCGRYSHAARVCRSEARCWTCSGSHNTKDCTNDQGPNCCNCGGPHKSDSLECQHRSLQVKICEVKATHQTSFKTARKAVISATKTYAAAIKTNPEQATTNETTGPRYIPNVAHPRPPQPATTETLNAIFRTMITILTAATTTGDLTSALKSLTDLFRAHSDAEPFPA